MKKVKLISMVMLLSFVLMGAAFAVWSESLTVGGTVNTGYLDTVFTTAAVDGDNEAGLLDVAATTVTSITDPVKVIDVTIDNGYPGYVSHVTYTVTNNGTIPVALTEVIAGDTGITVDSDLPPGHVLTDGQSVDVTLTTTVLDNAQQDTTYHFTVTITATQAQ